MRTPTLLALSLLSTTLLACGADDPPPPTEVREAITGNLGYVLREAKAASDGTTASLPTGAAFGFATSMLDTSGTTARLLRPLSDRLDSAKQRQGVDGETVDAFDPDALVAQLNDELFTDENYLGDGIYRVPASLVCERTTYDENTGTETTSIDPDCAQNLDRAQLRVRVASDDDGIRFFLQIDANHDEPFSLLLGHDTLAITVNLDDATDAMIALAELMGEQAPNVDLSGQITGSIKILGAAHARVGVSFDRAIAIAFAEQGAALTGPSAFRFTSVAAQVASAELDGNPNAPNASFNLGLGETTIHEPATDFDAETDVDLAGATVNAMFQGNTLSLADLSLGTKTTTVSVGGQHAIAIDLNPSDGRKLTATITVDPATLSETLAVSPKLDLQRTVDHAVLGDEVPVYDVTRVQLQGSLHSSELTDQLEVVSGSFAITTTPSQYGFSATTGQCVTATDEYDSTTFTSYTLYSVGSCL